jgi:TetR/AcrR family transcriptional repressor of nem operon
LRVSKAKAADNRRRILTTAARLFRQHGIDSCGVDAITKAAGLTHGAFYSQFASKQAVAVEAIGLALAASQRALDGAALGKDAAKAFPRIVDAYLARAHRDSPGEGCVIAALGSDLARQPRSVREAFTEGLRKSLELLATVVPGRDASSRYDEAIAALARLSGALILARAVSDEALSRRILKAAARRSDRRRVR